MNNLTGKTFGHLVVLGPTNRRSSKQEIIWECRCECSEIAYYRTSKLSSGSRRSCGNCRKEDRKKRHWSLTKKDRAKQGKVKFSSLPLVKQLKIINEFCFGLNYRDLSEKHKVTYDTLRSGIQLYRERLNSAYELHYMANLQKTTLSTDTIKKALKTEFILPLLQDMLSPDTTEVLTDHELMYCYLFVNTGSNEIALKESQLVACLTEQTPVRLQYLGMYLREKPNLKQYILLLQDDKLKEVKASKQTVQRELITQIEQLKEIVALGGKASDRANIIRCIELLGKTEGVFTEKVQIEEVKAADALDKLLDMAKSSVSQDGTEVWDVPGDTSSKPVGLLGDGNIPKGSPGVEPEPVP